MLIFSLLLVSKALAVDYKFKFNIMDEGFQKTEGKMYNGQGNDLIATAPEVIALSAFDQNNLFGEFASAVIVNAAAYYGTSGQDGHCVLDSSYNFLNELKADRSTSTGYDKLAQKNDFQSYLDKFVVVNSLITAVIDKKGSLKITRKGAGSIIVFRNSCSNKRNLSFLPVFVTSDELTKKMTIPIFENFEILENDIVIVCNTWIRSLALLSHITVIFNLAILSAMKPGNFSLHPDNLPLNKEINELIKSTKEYIREESKQNTESNRSVTNKSLTNISNRWSSVRSSNLDSTVTYNPLTYPLERQIHNTSINTERPALEPKRFGTNTGQVISSSFSGQNNNYPNSHNSNYATPKEREKSQTSVERSISRSGIFSFSQKEEQKFPSRTYPRYMPGGIEYEKFLMSKITL
jgi:hypothetical protein